MSSASTWLRPLASTLSVGVLLFGILTARVLVEGERELAKSDTAFNQGDLRDAILHARRSATLYAPGAPHVRAAYARLSAVAIGAEASGQADVARLAWGGMRGAALESRHLFTPHARELELADANLARLDTASGGDRAAASKLLSRDDAPRAPWILSLGAGFVLFLLGGGLAASRGVGQDGRLAPRMLAVSVAVALIGAACWTLAVYRA